MKEVIFFIFFVAFPPPPTTSLGSTFYPDLLLDKEKANERERKGKDY